MTSMTSCGRAKLPTWVVRIRVELFFMGVPPKVSVAILLMGRGT